MYVLSLKNVQTNQILSHFIFTPHVALDKVCLKN